VQLILNKGESFDHLLNSGSSSVVETTIYFKKYISLVIEIVMRARQNYCAETVCLIFQSLSQITFSTTNYQN